MDKILLPRAPEQMDIRTRKFIDLCSGVLNALILDGTILPSGPGGWVIVPSALGRAGAGGPPGKAGQDGSRILSSIGAPAQSLGTVGDWCFDKVTKDVYQKIELFGMPPLWRRQFGLWGGPPGPRGEKGETGPQGPPGAGGTGSSGSSSGSVSACHVTRSTSQTFTTGSEAAISYDGAVRNDGGLWIAGSPTRFTAAEAGWHGGGASVWWTASTGLGRRLIVRLGGSTLLARASTTAPADHNDPSLCVSWQYYLTAGQYVEYSCMQNQGGDVTIKAGAFGWMQKL